MHGLIIGAIVLFLLGNSVCGLIYGKMWLQNRVIDKSSPRFVTLIVGQLFAAAIGIVALMVMR